MIMLSFASIYTLWASFIKLFQISFHSLGAESKNHILLNDISIVPHKSSSLRSVFIFICIFRAISNASFCKKVNFTTFWGSGTFLKRRIWASAFLIIVSNCSSCHFLSSSISSSDICAFSALISLCISSNSRCAIS